MRGKGVILLSLLLVISAVLIIAPAESSNVLRIESAPMPTWNVGDMWNYTASMWEGDVTGGINIKIVSTETVATDTDYNVYNTTTHFEYAGTVEGIYFSGTVDSITYYWTSTLAIVKEISTVNEDYGIYGTYYNHTVTTYNPPKDYNQFPITVGEEWNVNVNAHIVWDAVVFGVPDNGESDSAVVENYECIRTDSVCVAAGTYNVFVINSTIEEGNETSYYSPDVCNFVKSELYDETGTLTGEIDLVSYSISATPTTGTITGHVYISGTTTGISDANVSINATTYAITDANGKYTLSGVAPGTHTVTASATDYASSSESVTVSAGGVKTQDFYLTLLSETGNISGRVTADGTGLNNATVTVEGTGLTSQTNVTGHYIITGVPAGSYNVTAFKVGYQLETESNVVVYEGQITYVNFTLTAMPLAKWTYMCYLDGDNDLWESCGSDFDEIVSVGSTSEVNIVVLKDNEGTCDTNLYYINIGGGLSADIQLSNVNSSWGNEVDMGSPYTLIDFAQWTIDNYPAEHYGLDLWDHGGGYDGLCWDDTSGTHITMPDLRYAMSSITNHLGGTIDLIIHNSCSMGEIEADYEIKAYVDFIVHSEETMPNDGIPYASPYGGNILGNLINNSGWTPQEFAIDIVDQYSIRYAQGNPEVDGDETFSAVNTTKLDDSLMLAVNNFAQKLKRITGTYSNQTVAAWNYVEGYHTHELIDLYDFASLIKANVSDVDVKQAAQYVMDNVTNCVINEWHGINHSNSHGLTICFPLNYTQLVDIYDKYEPLHMTVENKWVDFLFAFFDQIDYPNDEPNCTITSPSDDEKIQQSTIVTISGTASDSDDINKTQIKIDRGDWKDATGTTSWSYALDTSDLSLGMHKIYARAIDNKGSQNIDRDYSWYQCVTVNIVLSTTTGTITGHVYKHGTTTPIDGANVSINTSCHTLTDENGVYTLLNVVPGTYTVTASATDYASSSESVTVTAGAVETQDFYLTLLSETGNITGTVTTDGTALDNATVTVKGTSFTVQTNVTGHYIITGVPAGSYNVTASKSGYVSSNRTNVTVIARNTTELNFVLTIFGRGSISGTIKDKDGNPVIGATVKAYDSNNTVVATAYTNLTGGYTLSNLLPGTYTINVSKAGFQEYSMSVTVGANQTVTKNAELTTETTDGEDNGGETEGGAGIADYWWVGVVIAVIIVVVLVVLKKRLPVGRRMPVPREEPVREEMPVREEVAPEKIVGKRFCIKCGREISKTAGFCPYCGYRFKK